MQMMAGGAIMLDVHRKVASAYGYSWHKQLDQ